MTIKVFYLIIQAPDFEVVRLISICDLIVHTLAGRANQNPEHMIDNNYTVREAFQKKKSNKHLTPGGLERDFFTKKKSQNAFQAIKSHLRHTCFEVKKSDWRTWFR